MTLTTTPWRIEAQPPMHTTMTGAHRIVRIVVWPISTIILLSLLRCANAHSCSMRLRAAVIRLAACGSPHFKPIRLSVLNLCLPTPARGARLLKSLSRLTSTASFIAATAATNGSGEFGASWVRSKTTSCPAAVSARPTASGTQ